LLITTLREFEALSAETGSSLETTYIRLRLDRGGPWQNNCYCSVRGDLQFVEYYWVKIVDCLKLSRPSYWVIHKISYPLKAVLIFCLIFPMLLFIPRSGMEIAPFFLSIVLISCAIALVLPALIEFIAIIAFPCGEFAIGRGLRTKDRRNKIWNIIFVAVILAIVVGIVAIFLHDKIFGPSPPNSAAEPSPLLPRQQ
jgi:hypothetical protein